MKYNVLHSLQHMATVKIALAILNDSEIESMLRKERKYSWSIFTLKFYSDRHELWKQIKMKAVQKLHCLPDLLQTTVYNYIQPLHMECDCWMIDHGHLLSLHPPYNYVKFKKSFCWKTDGSIDRVETAKKIVQNETFNPNTRFKMACTYFLEKEVFALWHGNKQVRKKSKLQKETSMSVRFWIKWLSNRSGTPWRLMVDDYFRIPCFRRWDIPLRFSCFFPYLSQENRKSYLQCLRWHLTMQRFDKDDFFSCLWEMNETECSELLALIPRTALNCCLNWPFQTMFIEMANQLKSYMGVHDCDMVLVKIAGHYIMRGLRNFDYGELYKEFWNLSPVFVKEEIEGWEGSSKMIKVILNYDGEKQLLPLEQILDGCVYAEY